MLRFCLQAAQRCLVVVLDAPLAYVQNGSATVRQAIQFSVDETVRDSDVVIPCELMDMIALRNAVKQASPHSEIISFSHSVFYYLLSPV